MQAAPPVNPSAEQLMPGQVVIENPVINSPFEEPSRHFKFDKDGITDEVVKGRRVSAYFVPVPGIISMPPVFTWLTKTS